MSTKAMPVSGERCCRSSEKASTPPADAPAATTGKATEGGRSARRPSLPVRALAGLPSLRF